MGSSGRSWIVRTVSSSLNDAGGTKVPTKNFVDRSLRKNTEAIAASDRKVLNSPRDALKKDEAHKASDLLFNPFEAMHPTTAKCLRDNRNAPLRTIRLLKRTGAESKRRTKLKVPLPRSVFAIAIRRIAASPERCWG